MGVRSRMSAVKECLHQYEISALIHYEKGFNELAAADAFGIGLMGLSAEMILKAAFFRMIGYSPTQEISDLDRAGAKAEVKILGVVPTTNLHDLMFWSEAIIAVRAFGLPTKVRGAGATPSAIAANKLDADDEDALRNHAQRLMTNWNIEDRYFGIQPFATQDDLDEVFEDVAGIIKMYDDGTI